MLTKDPKADQSQKSSESMATTVLRIAAAQGRNARQVKESSTCDDSYIREYRLFKEWVDDHGEIDNHSSPDGDNIYLTRDNIDLYFSEHVAPEREGNRGTITRIRQGLEWFADNKEHIGTGFVVNSDVVKLAINSNLERQKNSGSTKPGEDPHKDLKDVLLIPERLLMMDCIYSTRPDWGPASFRFTWGNNAAVRGGSTRNLVFSDFNLSRGFGAEEDGLLSKTLFLIMRKGGKHKDRFSVDQQVACWRHNHYQLCSVFSASMWTLWNLMTERQDPIEFLHPNKEE